MWGATEKQDIYIHNNAQFCLKQKSLSGYKPLSFYYAQSLNHVLNPK